MEEALALLDEKCGECEEAKNFGRYNSCLKKVRNGIRKLGALDEEVRSALGDARKECKATKKGNKGKGDKEEGDEDDDDSEDDSEE